MTIRYEKISQNHVDGAVNLVMDSYNEERDVIPFIPEGKDYLNILRKDIKNLFIKGSGFAAIDNNELIGFIAGFEVDELFGKYKGIYIPLYGHSVTKGNCKRIYQDLYQYAAKKWVKEEYLTHAITLFSDIKETVNTWFWMGFGLRCIDSIREVKPIQDINLGITVSKATLKDIPDLAHIHRDHNLYYRQSPIFMPRQEEDPIEDLTNWLKKDNHHLWIASSDSKVLGYMGIQPTGETFISGHKDIMNITSGYVTKDSRKSNVGSTILNSVQRWLKENDYPLCGVDFESINIVGSNFWTKYFIPYTYSVVRRIDERIL